MSNIPSELKYTQTHEWLRQEDDGTVVVGITDHAQSLLGDLVFVELPEVGSDYSQGDECGVVESVKAASDIYAPLHGEIIAVNENLSEQPELVNQDPYGEGWIFSIKLHDESDLDELLDKDAYAEHISSKDEE